MPREREFAKFIPFTAQTRMSGCDVGARRVRKGAVDAVAEHVKQQGGAMPAEVVQLAWKIGDLGGTPLAVSEGARVLGLLHLKDVVKGGMRERFQQLRIRWLEREPRVRRRRVIRIESC